MNAKVIKCGSCSGTLNVETNRAYIFCQYCGCKNIIESEQMQVSVQVGDSINVDAKTNFDSLVESADYAIAINKFDKANELLISAIISGCNDYRVYIKKAMIDLHTDDNRSLFESIKKLISLEHKQTAREVTNAIEELMYYRGLNGVTVLHAATFHERFDMVVYCVEHGADVNSIARMDRVTPISVMFVPISRTVSKLDGTPFIRNKAVVKQIRNYLLSKGARDRFRFGY